MDLLSEQFGKVWRWRTMVGVALFSVAFFGYDFGTAEAVFRVETQVKVYNSQTEHLDADFVAFDAASDTGGMVSVGDVVGDDGVDELIVSTGGGVPARVRVFSGDGAEMYWEFAPFGDDFLGGVDVSVGDVDGDDEPELVVVQSVTGDSRVEIWDARRQELQTEFRLFSDGFYGGVGVDVGDVVGDERDEIVIGVGLRNAGGVLILDGAGRRLITPFFPYGREYAGGVDVVVVDDDNGHGDVVVSSLESAGRPLKRYHVYDPEAQDLLGALLMDYSMVRLVYSGSGGLLDFVRFSPEVARASSRMDDAYPLTRQALLSSYFDSRREELVAEVGLPIEGGWGDAGVRLAAGDVDGDGEDEYAVAPVKGLAVRGKMFDMEDGLMDVDVQPFAPGFEGGLSVAIGHLDAGDMMELVVIPEVWDAVSERRDKHIEINLSEQRLYVWQGGVLRNTYLISAGKSFPTYPGEFAISEKIYNKHYKGYYGPGHPENFDLPNVKYNLRYDGPRLLHSAYWHNNFGNPMSHGCINMPIDESKWLYEWANLGDAVWVHY